MAHVCPPGLGTLFHLQQGFINRPPLPKDLNHFLKNQNPCMMDLVNPHNIDLSLQMKEDYFSSTSRLSECNKLVMIDSSTRNSLLANVQGTQLEMLLFGIQVAKQCNRQDSVIKFLESRSKGKETSFQDLLSHLGSQQPSIHLPLQPSSSRTSCWRFTDAESEWMSLAYPTKELYFNELSPETCNCNGSLLLHHDGQHMHNCSGSEGDELNALLSAFSRLQLPKTTMNTSSNLTMLVPYFEISRKSARSKKDVAPNLKAATTKKAKKQARNEEKKTTRISEGSDIYPDTYLHACDCLLSVIVHQKQPHKNAIHSLKKSGSQMLMDLTAGIAGTGIAVLLTVLYAVIGRGLPFCYPRILSAGFGLGLVWFSSALYKLRGTLMHICRSSGEAGGRLEKLIRAHLDRNVKDICFRAATLMAIAFLAIGLI